MFISCRTRALEHGQLVIEIVKNSLVPVHYRNLLTGASLLIYMRESGL